MPKAYWIPKDERGIRLQTARIRELREEIERALSEDEMIELEVDAAREAEIFGE